MRIALRCIYYKAVTPSCDIVDMDDATWKVFLHTGGNKRKEIALKLLDKEWLMSYVKEVVWIPLEGQDKLKEI
jgi:hypothetical protein